eukprot:TRINITY_DN7971_c0_g2_i1.p1 TRINITY_DN7971_c0_g2~~TRINITY_DN7971_c0_g2_i1.p1  ORF type:complete len:368 (+),score=50.44 TRINITY_DN7971_c0_g2_i1:28-1131(+)
MSQDTGYREIDGSVMEGGGQIIRITGCLSALLQVPVNIVRIRAGRASPGLKAQHLTGLHLIKDICRGSLQGADFGSNQIHFRPGKINGGDFFADTQSAGAVCLLAQIALPVALFAPQPSVLNLRGGTNADMAPQIDAFTEVFLQNLKHFGPNVEYEVVKKGFFPKGGGEINLFVNPIRSLQPIQLDNPGKLISVEGWCFCAGSLPIKVAESITRAFKEELRQADSPALRGLRVNIETYKEAPNAAFGNGSGIVVVAKTSTGCLLGGSALGSPKESTEETGRKAAHDLLEAIECGGCVDKYVQDQMVLFMGLAGGDSVLRTGPLTLHTETAIHITEKLTGAKFDIRNDPNDNSWLIHCKGIGFKNNYL